MAMWLLDDDLATTLEIPVAGVTQEALRRQRLRLMTAGDHEAFRRRLVGGVVAGLEAALDHDLRSPTKHQIAFATAIARALGVSLPGDALRYRGAMGAFLDRYGGEFKQLMKGDHGDPDQGPG